MSLIDILKQYVDRPTDAQQDFDEVARAVPAVALGGERRCLPLRQDSRLRPVGHQSLRRIQRPTTGGLDWTTHQVAGARAAIACQSSTPSKKTCRSMFTSTLAKTASRCATAVPCRGSWVPGTSHRISSRSLRSACGACEHEQIASAESGYESSFNSSPRRALIRAPSFSAVGEYTTTRSPAFSPIRARA